MNFIKFIFIFRPISTSRPWFINFGLNVSNLNRCLHSIWYFIWKFVMSLIIIQILIDIKSIKFQVLMQVLLFLLTLLRKNVWLLFTFLYIVRFRYQRVNWLKFGDLNVIDTYLWTYFTFFILIITYFSYLSINLLFFLLIFNLEIL